MLGWLLVATSLMACETAHPLIVAHRGGMGSGYPENTLPAFRHAVGAGAQVLEVDLRTTRDGRVVILHDRRVDRTTNGRGPVSRFHLDELARLDAGRGARIPTLADVLEQSRRMDVALLLDIKRGSGVDHAQLVAEARKHHLERIVFGVRTLRDHRRLTRLDPELRFLAFARRPRHIDGFLRAGVEIVRVWPHWIRRDPDLIRRVHGAGARVWVTAGDAPADELQTLAELGVDGLVTDFPGQARSALACR